MGLFDVFKDKDEDSDDGGMKNTGAKILHLVIHQSLNQLKKQPLLNPVMRLPLLSSL